MSFATLAVRGDPFENGFKEDNRSNRGIAAAASKDGRMRKMPGFSLESPWRAMKFRGGA
jgi:hypothetical protein